MNRQLLEIGLYFYERTDPETQKHMELHDVGDMLLVCYPSHLFAGKRNIMLDYGPPVGPGLLVLYNHLVADPQIE